MNKIVGIAGIIGVFVVMGYAIYVISKPHNFNAWF